jgi:hypothetical protein
VLRVQKRDGNYHDHADDARPATNPRPAKDAVLSALFLSELFRKPVFNIAACKVAALNSGLEILFGAFLLVLDCADQCCFVGVSSDQWCEPSCPISVCIDWFGGNSGGKSWSDKTPMRRDGAAHIKRMSKPPKQQGEEPP